MGKRETFDILVFSPLRSSTSSDQSVSSAPPNFRYSNPPHGNPPLHEDVHGRKSLQMTDPRDKKVVNIVAVSFSYDVHGVCLTHK